jgi:hypothetical protein
VSILCWTAHKTLLVLMAVQSDVGFATAASALDKLVNCLLERTIRFGDKRTLYPCSCLLPCLVLRLECSVAVSFVVSQSPGENPGPHAC